MPGERRDVALDGAAVVEELEEVSFVGLFPLDAVGGVGAEVEPLDVRAEEELADELRIFREAPPFSPPAVRPPALSTAFTPKANS